jgi:hypothetical protein
MKTNEWHALCSELLAIENELEFRKETNLDTESLIKRKKEINQRLKYLKSKKKEDLDNNI